MEICQHRCHAAGPFIVTFHKPGGSSLHHLQFVAEYSNSEHSSQRAKRVANNVSFTVEIWSKMG